MSTTTLLIILSVCELALVALGYVVFLTSKKFKQAKEVKVTADINTSVVQKNSANFANLLQEQLTNTESRINVCSQEEAELLKSRVKFIKSELLAVDNADKDDEDAYWSSICERMTDILPVATPSNADLTELGDIDGEDKDLLNEPPVLENNIAIDNSLESENIEQESDLAEITRLRKIVGRQHNAIIDLKRMLNELNLEEEVKLVLERKLEETEVAHAHLSMSIATLDTEIFSLENQLKARTLELEKYQSTESDPPMFENSIDESVTAEIKENQTDVIEDLPNTSESIDPPTLGDASTMLFDQNEDDGDLSSPMAIDDNDELMDIEISDLTAETDALAIEPTAESETAELDTSAVDESATAASKDDDQDLGTPMESDDFDDLEDIEISELAAEIDAISIDSAADSEATEVDTPANDESMPSNLDAAIDEMLDLTADNSTK